MKVLAILEAGEWIPSGVVRALIYKDLFVRDGFDVDFISRQPIETLTFLEDPRPGVLRRIVWRRQIRERIVARATRQREEEILRRAASADVLYLVKVVSPELIRRLRAATRARIVLDFGDAVWLYDDRKNERDFQEILGLVDAVTTDNALTAEYVRRHARSCTVIPDSPQTEKFDERRAVVRRGRPDVVILGWIGTPSTLYNLYEIWEALEVVARRHPQVELRLVGAGNDPALRPPFERVRYSAVANYDQAGMVDEILGMDVGLFPLQRVERCEVRGVLKAALYMSGETPVIASPVGQLPELITHGVNGLLADTREEWIEQLEALILDPSSRRRLGAAGLESVRKRYTTEKSWAMLRDVLTATAR